MHTPCLPSSRTRRLTLARIAALIALAAAAPTAQAQPLDGPLHIVVGYAPWGATDRVARIVGDKLQAKLGVNVIVENKTGAGGRLAAQQVKATPANQNVLMVANPAVMVIAPLVFKDNMYTQAQTAAMLKAFRAQWAPIVQKSGYHP